MRILLFTILFSLAACSVKTAQVDNRPPELAGDVVQFNSEFGLFKIQSATLFLWPDGLTEAQVEEVVKTVNGASEKGDQLKIEAGGLLVEKATLEAQFKEANCNSNMTDACASNQARRHAILERLNTIVTVEEPKLKAAVILTIDPGYPEKIENMKSIDAKGSEFLLRADTGQVQVQVSLKDFLVPGHIQSTETLDLGRVGEATYLPQRNLLMFSVPELNADGRPTGLIYRFALERCPDFAGLARFKGDIKVMNGARVVRYGSASFEASVEN